MDIKNKVITFKRTVKELEDLEKDYQGKIKGMIYTRRLSLLQRRLEYLVKYLKGYKKDVIVFWKAEVEVNGKHFQIDITYPKSVEKEDVTTLIELNSLGKVITINPIAEVLMGTIVISNK